jgi:hypothetical protein
MLGDKDRATIFISKSRFKGADQAGNGYRVIFVEADQGPEHGARADWSVVTSASRLAGHLSQTFSVINAFNWFCRQSGPQFASSCGA